jgi:dienelactone hydrolase
LLGLAEGVSAVDPQDLLRKTVVYSVPGMERARMRRDVAYKTTDEGDLRLDVYTPEDGDGGAPPVVVFVHGDGPPDMLRDAKDWGQYTSWGQLAAASGLAGIAFNHRSTLGFTRLDEVAADVDDLLAFVAANAATLGVDAARLGVCTFSAGGPVGVRAALREAPAGASIRCAVAYYTLLDVRALRAHLPASVTDETLLACSPVALLEEGERTVPPLFVARAGLDRPDLNAGLDRFIAAALTRNATLDVMSHPAGRHGFDVLDDNERSRAIIRHTLEFMQAYLLG